MTEKKYDTPESAAAALAAGVATVGPSSDAHNVCLGPADGAFKLFWDAKATGTYDWVGLYRNAGDPDDKYVSGSWQWATKGNSYVTGTHVDPGYQARYLVWDANARKYKSVAKTPGFPAKVCVQ